MATLFSALLPVVRSRLIEPVAKFWTDDEITQIMILGARDLWRDVVDLKQEHFLTIDATNVTFPANSTQLAGVPADVHKIYIIEPRDLTINGSNSGLSFKPLEYNNLTFQAARAMSPIDPSSSVLYYAIHQAGAPVGSPIIKVSPQVTSTVLVAMTYVPALGALTVASPNPVPGESDAAIIAWTVAFARAKEREDRSPDPAWIQDYATQKAHLLQSLGLRQYQEPSYAEAIFSEYW